MTDELVQRVAAELRQSKLRADTPDEAARAIIPLVAADAVARERGQCVWAVMNADYSDTSLPEYRAAAAIRNLGSEA